jgi:hypothetical protein
MVGDQLTQPLLPAAGTHLRQPLSDGPLELLRVVGQEPIERRLPHLDRVPRPVHDPAQLLDVGRIVGARVQRLHRPQVLAQADGRIRQRCLRIIHGHGTRAAGNQYGDQQRCRAREGHPGAVGYHDPAVYRAVQAVVCFAPMP